MISRFSLALLVVFGSAAAVPAGEVAGVIAAIEGRVTVERAGVGSSATAELGMRLAYGDTVRVADSGAASVYLIGGGIRRVTGGEQLTLTQGAKEAARESAPVSSAPALRMSETGLWTLNDPDGRILLAAMRGEDDGFDAMPGTAELLSPRYETVVTSQPSFHAVGGARPATIVIAAGKQIIGRSAPVDGDGPWSIDGVVKLAPGAMYSWRLESVRDGSPLSGWVPFRASSKENAELARSFEGEIRSLSSAPGGSSAADLLRCGYYLETKSWTPLLAAALRLLETAPDSQVAQRARDRAIRGLRLDAERAALLAKRLGS